MSKKINSAGFSILRSSSGSMAECEASTLTWGKNLKLVLSVK